MSAKKARPLPATPEERIAEHQRQMLLQVWLPLAAGLLIVLAIAALTVWGAIAGSSQVERWGNLSAIYVMIPSLFSSLLSIVLLVLMIRGLAKLIRKLPGWMYILQAIFARLNAQVYQAANRAAAPVMTVGSFIEGLKAVSKNITRKP